MKKSFFTEIIYGKRDDFLSALFMIPFFYLSLLYRLLLVFRNSLYSFGILKVRGLSCKVISVGNITLGGSGKTPFVAYLAERLRDKGYRVAVLSRGYKRKKGRGVDIVSDGERNLLNPDESGDEPYMLAQRLKGIPVIVGKNRYEAGRTAVREFHTDVLILDDGFQHLPLKRDVDVLLFDATLPFSTFRIFPAGILREPISAINRADIILFTQCHPGYDPEPGRPATSIRDDFPLYHSIIEPIELVDLNKNIKENLGYMIDKKILAFCGIGNPESFRSTLLSLNADVRGFLVFPDHHSFSKEDMKKIYRLSVEKNVDMVITTQKDGIRLLKELPAGFPLWELRIRLVVKEDDALENDILKRLQV
jgi:tetraacyldisaccharide 4'-kinase